MSNPAKFAILYLLLIIYGSETLSAQNDTELIALPKAITTIEQHFNISINYDVLVFQKYKVQPIDTLKNLSLIFSEIATQLPIVFSLISPHVYYLQQNDIKYICGYLRDIDSDSPIAGAQIILGKNGAISDLNGYYSLLKPTDTVSLEISYLGYGKLNIPLPDSENCMTQYLTEETEFLKQVTLKSYIVDGIDLSQNGAIEINNKEFSLLPGLIENDILFATQALPQISSINETTSNLNIRGGSNDQNLISWDAIKMYQSGHFFGLISNFNPQITNKAIITTNGSDASMTDGVSGTIALYTDETITKKTKGTFSLNLLSANAFIDLPIVTDASLQVAARTSVNDIYSTPTYTSYFNRISQDTEVEENENGIINSDKDFQFYDVSLRYLHYLNEKDHLRINFIISDNDLNFTENGIVAAIETQRKSSISQQNIGAGILYKRAWNDKTNSTLQVYETDYQLKAINSNISNQQRFLQENSVSETGITASVNHSFTPTLFIDIGYQFTETEITDLNDIDNPRFRRLFSSVLRKHAVFTQSTINIADALTINAGIRANYLDKLDALFVEPRLSVLYKLDTNWNYKVKGELKHQTTTQVINFQNDFLGIEKRRWQLANGSTIPVLKSKQVSTGFLYNKNRWLVDTEVYYKQVTGITTQSQGFQVKYEFTKTIGSYDVFGTELLIRHRGKQLTNWFSYAFMNNTYQFLDLPESNFPSNFDIRHHFTFGSTYSKNALKISGGLNWRTGAPSTAPLGVDSITGTDIQYASANSNRLPSYFRVDLSGLYSIIKTEKINCELGASFWNVLNHKNRINTYYRIINDAIEQFDQNALDVTANAVFRVSF